MKKAYLVVGPESSGTRIVTRLFVEAGCVGAFTHNQPLDRFIQQGKYDLNKHGEDARFVLRRSIPHGMHMPDFAKVDVRFKSCGCKTLWVVLFREWFALSQSKVRQGHQKKKEEAEGLVKPQFLHVFKFLAEHQPDFYMLDTSLMFLRPRRALKQLENVTGLKFKSELIKDEDAKYEGM